MTVEKLIAELEKLDPKSQVHVACDEEGNQFHNLTEVQGEYGVAVLWPGGGETNPLG